MAEALAEKQRVMHKNFFDRCQAALDNGFYLEALFLEYSAMEGRLEVILGLLGMPCNKDKQPAVREQIMFSHRIQCLRAAIRQQHPVMEKTKLTSHDMKQLDDWRKDRNIYIHGLAKNAEEYQKRMQDARRLAEDGCELMTKLYNEANRLRSLNRRHKELFDGAFCCKAKGCSLHPDKAPDTAAPEP